MSWSSVGDFNTLEGVGAETSALVVNEGFLYVVAGTALWRWNGSTWTDTGEDFDGGRVYASITFDDDIYFISYFDGQNNAGGIFRYNEIDGLVVEVNESGQAFRGTNFVEHDGDIYVVNHDLDGGSVLKRNGGTWDTIDSDGSDPWWALGTYQSEMYLSSRVGNKIDGANKIYRYAGGTFSVEEFSEAVGGDIIFLDTFTGSGVLESHTPDIDDVGGGWIDLATETTIFSNTARRNTEFEAVTVANTGESDVTISADVGISAIIAGYQGIIARVQDVDNMWLFVYVVGDEEIHIIERNGGVDTIRASLSLTGISGTVAEFVINLSGNDIIFAVNGFSVSYTSNSFISETEHGFVVGANPNNVGFVDNFQVSTGEEGNFHTQARRMLEFGTFMYAHDNRYMHRWSGASWILDTTFPFDLQTTYGMRDMIAYDGKLWTGSMTSIYVLDGSTWAEDPDSDIGYQQERDVTHSGTVLISYTWNPPIGFAVYNSRLYVCAGPGEVFVRDLEAGFNVKGIGISKSKGNDELLYVTLWRPDELVFRVYDMATDPPTAELEEILGSASLAEVNAGTLIAYPHAPREGSNGRCFVYGRFDAGTTHIMRTINAGSSFTIVEDSWGADVCGAMFTRHGKVYAVRNKTTLSYLYSGFTELTYLNTLPFPVNPFSFKLSPTFKALFAGNNIGGDSPRVIGLSYPFTGTVVDLTTNYPTAGEVNAIVPL